MIPMTRRMALTGLAATMIARPAGAGTAAAGEVLALTGQAAALRAAASLDLAPRDAVFAGDAVTTGLRSRIDIRLGTDTTLYVGEQARFRIDDFLAEAGGEIFLDSGALLLDKAPASGARPLEVNSAFGQIAVRGTRVFIGPSKGVFGIFLDRGRVTVSAAGVTVTLAAGEGTDIASPGAAPSAPKAWGPARIAEALAPFS